MEQRLILVFLCPRLDFFAGDPAAAGSGQSWRPARRPEVQMCRFSGLHLRHIQVCACVCMHAHPFNAHEWDWLNYSSELTFYSFPFFFFFFHWKSALCDLSSRTVNFDIVKYLYDFLWASSALTERWHTVTVRQRHICFCKNSPKDKYLETQEAPGGN